MKWWLWTPEPPPWEMVFNPREEGRLCSLPELLLVSLCLPAAEKKGHECVPPVQPSVLPPPDTRVASQESQVTAAGPVPAGMSGADFSAVPVPESCSPLELGQSRLLSELPPTSVEIPPVLVLIPVPVVLWPQQLCYPCRAATLG